MSGLNTRDTDKMLLCDNKSFQLLSELWVLSNIDKRQSVRIESLSPKRYVDGDTGQVPAKNTPEAKQQKSKRAKVSDLQSFRRNSGFIRHFISK